MSTTDRTPSIPAVDDRLSSERIRSHVTAYGSGMMRLFTHGGRAAAFWLAALLPLTYVPMVVAGTATDRPLLLGALLAAHVAALLLGRDHAVDTTSNASTPDATADRR